MSVTESSFWENTCKPRLSLHGDFVRVENTVGGGTPDVNYAVGKAGGWIELKIARAGELSFRPFQVPWAVRRSKATLGRGMWLLWREHERAGRARVYALPGWQWTSAQLHPGPKSKPGVSIIRVEELFKRFNPSAINWDRFVARLREEI